MNILEKLFGNLNKKYLKEITPLVADINKFEADFERLSGTELKEKTAEFRARLAQGQSLEDILPEAYAAVREAAKRTLAMRHYDVQLIGGIALHRGMIAEMRTGEGKTLVATLPSYLNALEGKGVHVITVNDYLAKRDAVWMGQIYDALGLSVGIIQNLRVSFLYDVSFKGGQEGTPLDTERDQEGSFKVEDEYLKPATRQEAYRADITYGTNNEFGFDYLRDNMVQNLEDMVMRPGNEMHYAIVDEVDSILIDESRTPLIISAPTEQATEQYYQFANLVKQLKENEDYNVDEKMRSSTLTEQGIMKFEEWLGIENIYVEAGIRTVHHIEQALKAEVLFKRDKDYIVDDGEVIIIDEFTGRKMPGRRYSEGLHQAIEAKEGVRIQRESQTLATITYQNLFRMYRKLSGMTGTAETEKEEFYKIYGLDVLVLPTNKPDQRKDLQDRIYKTELGKYKAVAELIQERRDRGQPILVGTISVEKNERLSEYLNACGIAHEALNAKNHEREGQIIAQAGRPGAVTLATNMAGRGVDIKLGGAPVDSEEEAKVKAAGGLFVLGTERHESRRIDNQLRGRAARQGDLGMTQFFVSTDDDLMRIFAGDRLKGVMTRLKVPEDMPIEQKMVTRMLENAQKKVEAHHYDMRKHLLEYDDVLNKQRDVIYKKRREILELYKTQFFSVSETLDGGSAELGAAKDSGSVLTLDNTETSGLMEPGDAVLPVEEKQKSFVSLEELIIDMIESEIEFVVGFHTNTETGQDWNISEIYETMKTIFPFNSSEKENFFAVGKHRGNSDTADFEARSKLTEFLSAKARVQFEVLRAEIARQAPTEKDSKHIFIELQKSVLLRSYDALWVEHLVSIDYLRTSIGLRGYAQRDPLLEYKRESFSLFNQLLSDIQKEVVYTFFKLSIGIQLAPSVMANDKMTLKGAEKTTVTAGGEAVGKERSSDGEKVGRNDPCPCGSGKKYKRCHGA
ncbi:MAG: preprotein translocase subunit SecA [Candidatus Magasanikbacteria bacterium]|nr:preprotein translocase subunit SecA [Candidatus Magasanikbacteria bacterium]